VTIGAGKLAMSIAPAFRAKPLVYASARALEDARRLLPRGLILENLVSEAIAPGDVSAGTNGGLLSLTSIA
jgi:hypothetical protein